MNYRSILIATVQTIGLFVAGITIPLLGQILALFTPVPLILVSVREGKKEGLITLIAATVIIGILGGWQVAAVLFLSFGLMAIGTSEGMRKGLKPEQIALLGGLLPIAVLGLSAGIYVVLLGKNPAAEIDAYLRESIAAAVKTYTELGLKDMATMASSLPDNFVYYMTRLLPSILIATFVVQAACCYIIARALIMKKQAAEPGRASLASWHAPDPWVWGLIAALALIVIPQETARLAGWNLAVLFAVVYLTQGTALVDYYLRKIRIKTFARGVLFALILALPPTLTFVITIGVVDIWADFRKVRLPALKQ